MPSPFTQLYAHLVWATFDRQPHIAPEIEPQLYAALAAKCGELECFCMAVGGVEDHIPILVRCAPDVAISTLVAQLKGSTSHLINHVLIPEAGFRWQGSYGAFSVSKRSLRQASDYILGQKEHHRLGQVYEQLERCAAEDDPAGQSGSRLAG